MKITSNVVCLVVAGALAVGCDSSREVEVSGEVSAPATTEIDGEITLDFFDVVEDSEKAKSVHSVKLETLGSFKEKVEVEGDSVRVRALNDRDGNGAISNTEAIEFARTQLDKSFNRARGADARQQPSLESDDADAPAIVGRGQ